MSKERSIRVGITAGDANGIGYEVIMKALAPEGMTELCTPVIFGNKGALMHYRKACDIDNTFRYTQIADASAAKEGEISLVEVLPGENLEVQPGQLTEQGAKHALAALEAAISAWKNRQIDVLVTAPISKEAMKLIGFPYPGHTEYIAAKTTEDQRPLMILMSDNPVPVRVALATTHLPIKDVAGAISAEALQEMMRSLHHTLRADFAIERPKIAVLSLNPHAGDGGAIGDEEQQIITPAIEQASQRHILAFGPYAADGFFGSGKYANFDAILAMYHDQGLAPFKLMAMEHGVNYTASLPIVRTSPDHGTGFDIAGTGVADETSMREAIYAAIDIYRRRRAYIRSRSNPLKKQYVDRSGDREVLDLTKDDNTPDEILL